MQPPTQENSKSSPFNPVSHDDPRKRDCSRAMVSLRLSNVSLSLNTQFHYAKTSEVLQPCLSDQDKNSNLCLQVPDKLAVSTLTSLLDASLTYHIKYNYPQPSLNLPPQPRPQTPTPQHHPPPKTTKTTSSQPPIHIQSPSAIRKQQAPNHVPLLLRQPRRSKSHMGGLLSGGLHPVL